MTTPGPKVAKKRLQPGRRWRFKAGDMNIKTEHGPIFDELVVDSWLHIEQMDKRLWWLCIGDDMVMIEIGKDGKPTMGEWYK